MINQKVIFHIFVAKYLENCLFFSFHLAGAFEDEINPSTKKQSH